MLQTEMTTDTGRLRALSAGVPGDVGKGPFSVIPPTSPLRGALEARVRSGFGTHFGACVEAFMPHFGLYEHDSGATGVIGFRGASEGELFLEQYLEIPIEAVIAAASRTVVGRHRVVEVGQFVIDDRDAAQDFFRDLVPFLAGRGFDWVCFTGTNRIRAILGRIGFFGLPLAVARPDRIRTGRDAWGTYYDNEPIVIVGKLSDPFGHWCHAANADSSDEAGKVA